MKEVIARLRESKIHDEEESFKKGYKRGEEWAKNNATFAQLKRLERLDLSFLDKDESTEEMSNEEILALAILGPYKDQYAPDFWWNAGVEFCHESGIFEYRYDTKFWRGFVKGALDIWNQVADQVAEHV